MGFEEWCGYHACTDDDATNMGVIKQWTDQHRIEPESGDWPSLNEDEPRHWPIRVPFQLNMCAIHNNFSAGQGLTQEQMVEQNEKCIVDTCRQKCWYRQQRWEKLRDGEMALKSLTFYKGELDRSTDLASTEPCFNCFDCESDADCNLNGADPADYDNWCRPSKMCKYPANFIRLNPISLQDVIDEAPLGRGMGYGYRLDHGCGHFAVELLEDPQSFNFVKHTGTRAYCKMWPDVPVTYVKDAGEPEVTYYEYKSRCLPKEDIEVEYSTQTTTQFTSATFPSPLPDLE